MQLNWRGAEGRRRILFDSWKYREGRVGDFNNLILMEFSRSRERRVVYFKWDGGGYLFFNFSEQSYSCGLTENQSCNLLKKNWVGGLNQIIVLNKKERGRPIVIIIKFNGKGGGLNHSILLEKEVEEGGGDT